jgi:hypothetical protein
MGEPPRFICEKCGIVFESDTEGDWQDCIKCQGEAIIARSEIEMRGGILGGVFYVLVGAIFGIISIIGIIFSFNSPSILMFILLTALSFYFIIFGIMAFFSGTKRYRLAWGKKWDEYDKEPKRIVTHPLRDLSRLPSAPKPARPGPRE